MKLCVFVTLTRLLRKKFIKVKVGNILNQIYIILTVYVLFFNPFWMQKVKKNKKIIKYKFA